MDPTLPTHLCSQKKLAADLGISIADLKKMRAEELHEGEDWVYCPHAAFTPFGVVAVAVKLGMPATWLPAPTRETLSVIRLPKKNTRLLYCKNEAGESVTLLVRDNQLFMPRMKIGPCIAHPSQPGVYHYEGRLPRLKGRL